MATDTSSSLETSGGVGASGVQDNYDSLLGEIATLQADLSRTFGICQQLRSENDALRHNYEVVCAEAVNAKRRVDDLKQQCLEEAKARVAVERRHEELCHDWRAQLDQKEREMDEMQANMAPPRDLDILKLRIQEELEVPHAEKVAQLEGEVEHYQNEYSKAVRELAMLRTEFDQYTMDQGKEAQSNQEAHKAIVMELNAQIDQLQAKVDETAVSDARREVSLLKAQMEMKEADLLSENEQLRSACADAISRERDMATKLKGTVALKQTEAGKLAGERANAEARARAAEIEVKRLQRLLHEERQASKHAVVTQSTEKMEEMQGRLAELMEDREKRLEAEREVERLTGELAVAVAKPTAVESTAGDRSPSRRTRRDMAALEASNRKLRREVSELRHKNEKYKKRTREACTRYAAMKTKLQVVKGELYKRLGDTAAASLTSSRPAMDTPLSVSNRGGQPLTSPSPVV